MCLIRSGLVPLVAAISLVLGVRLHDRHVLLGLVDDDVVRKRHLRAHDALRVVRQHDLNLDAQHALAHAHVPDGLGDVVLLRFARGNEIAVLELHGLGALGAELAADDDLDALGTVLHDEADDAVARAACGKATQELVAQRLALSHRATGAVLNTLREQLDAVLREAIALLHNRRELADSAALLAQHLAGARRAYDDLCADGRDANLNTRIAVLGQRPHQELVQLSIEDTICHELALLGDLCLAGHYVRQRMRRGCFLGGAFPGLATARAKMA
mmetsp:Transcript_16539/g.45765  ORF Transcript_16539/g.45765 Transcript_16539/m.45765 type:complete len:273 (-) Transcript_16539:8-826(-)